MQCIKLFYFLYSYPAKWCCWDGDMSKTDKFYSEQKILLKMSIFVVFGCNSPSALNSSDFVDYTCSKSACWDGAMQNRQILFRAEDIPQKILLYIIFLSFLAITIPVRLIQMVLFNLNSLYLCRLTMFVRFHCHKSL